MVKSMELRFIWNLLLVAVQGPLVVQSQTTTEAPRVEVSTEPQVEGADLWCYECKEGYKREYDALNSPCLNNVTSVDVRQCTSEHKYCQVEKITINGMEAVFSIERGCTSECLYGCRFNGYGVTYKRCYSCCRRRLCNTDSQAPGRVKPNGRFISLVSGVMLLFGLNKILNKIIGR